VVLHDHEVGVEAADVLHQQLVHGLLAVGKASDGEINTKGRA
jgi:hypothetical protein